MNVLSTFMQTITEIKEIMHVHFKNLLAKLYLILVYIFRIAPGLLITCVQVTVLNLHNKLITVQECSQRGLKYPSSNDIYILPLYYRCIYLLLLEENINRTYILVPLLYSIFKEALFILPRVYFHDNLFLVKYLFKKCAKITDNIR